MLLLSLSIFLQTYVILMCYLEFSASHTLVQDLLGASYLELYLSNVRAAFIVVALRHLSEFAVVFVVYVNW